MLRANTICSYDYLLVEDETSHSQMALRRGVEGRRGTQFAGSAQVRWCPVSAHAQKKMLDSSIPTRMTPPGWRGHSYVVEVGGIEPPSSEVSAPASPSAAISEFSSLGTLLASFPRP